MKEIYLVRHGQTLFNALNKVQGISDTPLTEIGEKSAAALGAVFKREKIQFDRAFTSDLGRARQTGRLILSHSATPDLPLTETPFLREVSFGMFEGVSNREMWEAASRETGLPDLAWNAPDEMKIRGLEGLKQLDSTHLSENYDDVRKRVDQLLALFTASDKSTLLAVSHGLFINCLLFTISGGKQVSSTILNTSVTKLTEDNGRFQILYIGRTENL